MARYKKFIDADVVTEAKRRIHHIFDTFDTVAVCFSGGKDSLVCLELVWRVAQERGLKQLDVIFRDEELIPGSVVDFVDQYRQREWVRLRWFCVPLQSEKFILGKRVSYVQWDKDRQWVREKPPWAIVQTPGEYSVLTQYNCDEYCAAGLKGSVAFVTGVRAAESLIRYRSVVNKLNDNYICKAGDSGKTRIRLCKPIYDWSENDIFKWLGENGVPWCQLYDAQHLSGNNLRVSTPLHTESAKRLGAWRTQDPDFYQRVLDAFPEVAVQDRYWAEYDAGAVRGEYSDGFAGCKRYIEEQIEDPKQMAIAKVRLREFEQLNARQPAAYPADSLLRAFVSGSLKRVIQPLNKSQQAQNTRRTAKGDAMASK
jgi:predicted phosphoadenosine phosphosulfate sulfurtransferase